MKKENIFGLITTNKNLYHSFNIQKKIYLGIKTKYKKFYVIDMSNFLILKKKNNHNKKLKLPKDFCNLFQSQPHRCKTSLGRSCSKTTLTEMLTLSTAFLKKDFHLQWPKVW